MEQQFSVQKLTFEKKKNLKNPVLGFEELLMPPGEKEALVRLSLEAVKRSSCLYLPLYSHFLTMTRAVDTSLRCIFLLLICGELKFTGDFLGNIFLFFFPCLKKKGKIKNQETL